MAHRRTVTGGIDAISFHNEYGYVLTGWAISDDGQDAVVIDVHIDGQRRATSFARYFRCGRPETDGGFHGFSILIPSEFLSGHAARAILVTGDGEPLGHQTIGPFRGPVPLSGSDIAPKDRPVDVVAGVAMLADGGLFDTSWYGRAYPDVDGWCRETGRTPYRHFLSIGRAEHRFPHVPLNAAWYGERYGALIRSMTGGRTGSLIDHYHTVGAIFGFDAVPGFDEQGYLALHDDVRALVECRQLVSGYQHYLLRGAAEGRRTAPWSGLPALPPDQLLRAPELAAMVRGDAPGSTASPTGRNWALLNTGGFAPEPTFGTFAEALYAAHRPDVARAVADGHAPSGAEHWRRHGVTEDLAGTTPRLPGYCEHRYRVNNPDVSAAIGSREVPSGYHHFLSYGLAEGRKGGPDTGEPATRAIPAADILRRIAQRDDWPTISIVMPVYETPERWLRASIESVLKQIYPFWELHIVDDASPSPRIREILRDLAARDDRIRVTHQPVNGGIASASNTALSLATGDWIALLDHDDLLTTDALYEIATAILAHDPDAIYSDEDKMSVEGRLYDATHKPGWSPELLHATMYIGHLTCYRTALVRSLGGFRDEYDGTQDYDLALRVAAVTDRFVHVPKILYHWVAIPGSSADVLSAKSYAVERQKRAIEDAVARHATTTFEVRPHWSAGNWRVVYAPPAPPPLVSVIIPSAGRMGEIAGTRVDILKNCVMSLIGGECHENIEIIVVHNGELEASTLRFLRAIPNLREINAQQPIFNFSDRVNLGVERARGDFVLLLNDDIQAISKHFLRDMVGLACQPGVGIVGPRLLFANGTIQHVGILLPNGVPTHALIGEHRLTPGPQGIAQLTHNAAAATAACLLVSRRLYQEVGGFDPGLCLNYNDVDFCNKVRAKGLRIVIDPAVELYHFESLSKEGTFNWELQSFVKRWGIETDPYLNPNFSTATPFYEIERGLPVRPTRPIRDVEAQILARVAAARGRAPMDESIRFSFFMSIYRQPIRFLREIEKTILNQFYRNFEWVIVSDGDHRPELLDWLRDVAVHDNVTVIVTPENRGIMAGYGTAFQATRGDYALPVDADDFLTLDALQVMAEHIHAHGFPAILYSDEFKSDPQSRLHAPFHKPDFDRILHTNICFTCHLCAVRRDVAARVGAYTDPRATWSHDWDTFTRVERAGLAIVHVPHLLYAWRINPGSTASLETSLKPEALDSQRHVLSRHLALTGQDRSFAIAPNDLFPHPGIWRLAPVDTASCRIALVIVAGTFDEITADTAATSVAAILTQRGRSFVSARIRVAAPADAAILKARLERLGGGWTTGRVSLHTDPVPALLAEACADGDLVAFVQAGCAPVQADSLWEMATLLNGVGEAVAIGGRVLDPDDRIAWAGGFFGIGGFLATADYGRAAGDAGYHGTLFCQRFVDGVSPSHWMARGGFLRGLLAKLPPETPEDQLASAIALRAHVEDRRVLYTPFGVWHLSKRAHIQPPPLDEALVAAIGAPVPRESRWYNPRLHTAAELGYLPRGYD